MPTGKPADAARPIRLNPLPHPYRGSSRNLPRPLTPIIGREREVAALTTLLGGGSVRLVTLTGPGGVGKTRLALEVARALVDTFADGVAFVPLAPVREPGLVASALNRALDVRERGDRAVIDRLKGYLRQRELLLVLDNFEHVATAAPLLADLLQACPCLTVLVTSRARLCVSGEHTVGVAPLALPERPGGGQPDAPRLPPLERLAEYAAIRLFVDRAHAVTGDFALTAANAAVVAEICHRLDGLPLAIELAAARTRVLPPSALLARLDRRLPQLTGGARNQPTRLRTMRDAIAWSHDLLTPEEQALFRRLAVFVGGCTLEAADYVIRETTDESREYVNHFLDPRPSTLDSIASLVDKSLLHREEGPDGEPRFLLLKVVREYGMERLALGGEDAATRRRHAEWVLALAEQAEPDLWGPAAGRCLQRLEAEYDNVVAALRWAEASRASDLGLRLATALWRFWDLHGYLREVREALERALAPGGSGDVPPALRAKALYCLGHLAVHQANHALSIARFEEAIALFSQVGDRAGVAQATSALGGVAELAGDDERATAWYGKALVLFRELGNQARISVALDNLADAAYRRGDLDRAADLAREASAASRASGEGPTIVRSLTGAAQVACARGDVPDARALPSEALAHVEALGHKPGLAEALAGCGEVVAATGIAARAARLLGAATALCEDIGLNRLLHHEQYQRSLAAVRDRLDAEESAFAAAWTGGRALPEEQAVEEAIALTTEPSVGTEPAESQDVATHHGLTPREREVLRLIAAGYSTRAIADTLSISPATTRTHVARILGKLGVDTRVAAVAYAYRHGLA